MPSEEEMADAFAPFVKNLREAVERRAIYDKADTDSKLNAGAALAYLLAVIVFTLLRVLDASWWVWVVAAIIPIAGWVRSAKMHLDTMNANSDPED